MLINAENPDVKVVAEVVELGNNADCRRLASSTEIFDDHD